MGEFDDGAPYGCEAVEFVGGPRDGLRLVDGVEHFFKAMQDGGPKTFAITGDDVMYVPREHIEDGVLFLDAVGRVSDGKDGECDG